MSILSKIIPYRKDDIWKSRLRDLRGFRSFRVTFLRVTILSLRGFFQDQARASALTYYSALSVVPVLALLLGIAKGFGYEKLLQKQLMERLHGQEEVVSKITGFAHSLLEHTPGGWIAGLGVVFLFYSVINVLMNIEGYFNEIWHVQEGRPLRRKIADYLSFMLIGPVLFLMSSAITVVVATEVKTMVGRIDVLGWVSPFVLSLLNFSPYVTLWLLFSFMYMFMPNTRVRFVSGALAGIITGTVFQLFQWVYITFQIGVSRYNAIYGSVAAVPLFLLWMQLSWVIILIGAQISHAYQNAEAYDFESDCKDVSPALKRLLTMRVVHLLANSFSPGEGFWDESRISNKLGIPLVLLRGILNDLVGARLVSRVRTGTGPDDAFQPGRKTEDLSIVSVLKILESRGSNEIPTARSEELGKLSEAFNELVDLAENSAWNKRLVDI
jgi:membrane protein